MKPIAAALLFTASQALAQQPAPVAAPKPIVSFVMKDGAVVKGK
jgi:hypothetical protein